MVAHCPPFAPSLTCCNTFGARARLPGNNGNGKRNGYRDYAGAWLPPGDEKDSCRRAGMACRAFAVIVARTGLPNRIGAHTTLEGTGSRVPV